jgi:hypothetical protein
MGGTDGAKIGLLDEVFRLHRVADEPASEIVEGVEVTQRLCGQWDRRMLHEQKLSGPSSFGLARG